MYQENLDSNFKKMIFDAAKMYRKHRIRTKPKCAVYEPVGNAIADAGGSLPVVALLSRV